MVPNLLATYCHIAGNAISDSKWDFEQHSDNRKFLPFIGFGISQTFGDTKRKQKALGNSSDEFQAMLGIHSWF